MIVKRITNDELYHHGIKGQRWGVRRYQNADGSLTDAGRARYGYSSETGKMSKEGKKLYKQERKENIALRKQQERTSKMYANARTEAEYLRALESDPHIVKELKYHNAPSLEKSRLATEALKDYVNNEANLHAMKKTDTLPKNGEKFSFVNLPAETQAKYLIYGKLKAEEIARSSTYKQMKANRDKLADAGYEEAKKYYEQYLGEYANKTSKLNVGLSLVEDPKTGKRRKPTNAEMNAYFVTRAVTK